MGMFAMWPYYQLVCAISNRIEWYRYILSCWKKCCVSYKVILSLVHNMTQSGASRYEFVNGQTRTLLDARIDSSSISAYTPRLVRRVEPIKLHELNT